MGLPEGLIVYIVEDDASARKGLTRLMRSARLEPIAFEDAESFLNAVRTDVRQKYPACVLVDITMPRVSGLQLQARLKEEGVDLPVIAVSARDDDDTRRLARDLGARFFLRKPVDDQALLDAIHWVMDPGHTAQVETNKAS